MLVITLTILKCSLSPSPEVIQKFHTFLFTGSHRNYITDKILDRIVAVLYLRIFINITAHHEPFYYVYSALNYNFSILIGVNDLSILHSVLKFISHLLHLITIQFILKIPSRDKALGNYILEAKGMESEPIAGKHNVLRTQAWASEAELKPEPKSSFIRSRTIIVRTLNLLVDKVGDGNRFVQTTMN